MKVRQIETEHPQVIHPDASLKEAAKRMKELDVGVLPVCEGERLVGIITDRDIVVRALADGDGEKKLGDIVSSHIISVRPDDSIDHAVKQMRENAVRRLPVVDNGKIVGIISLGDLAIEKDKKSALGEISRAPANV